MNFLTSLLSKNKLKVRKAKPDQGNFWMIAIYTMTHQWKSTVLMDTPKEEIVNEVQQTLNNNEGHVFTQIELPHYAGREIALEVARMLIRHHGGPKAYIQQRDPKSKDLNTDYINHQVVTV